MFDSLVAREVDSAEKWHTLLQLLPNPHPLQSWQWGEIKSRWGWSMHPTVWQQGDKPLAAAMILKKRIPKSPFCVLYVPKGPVLDYADLPLRKAVINRLQQLARADRAIFIKIDADVVHATGVEVEHVGLGTELIHELESDGWLFSAEQIQFRNTVLLDLTRDEDEIMAAMKSKTRYNIRLAGRKEVTIRAGTDYDFEMIAGLYAQTSDRNEFAIRPEAYYLDVWHTFYRAGMLHPLIAEHDGKPLAAVMLVHYGDVTLYMYGASINAERQRMPTYLIQWEAIRWAKANGYKTYDFWGAPDKFEEQDRMWGVWRFKRGFNGVVTHHIGAWDYPAYPRLFNLYTEAMPRYIEWLRTRKQ